MEGNKSYKTYILGTLGNVKDCLRIVLFNKKSLSTLSSETTRITLYNIEEVYGKILKANAETKTSVGISLSRETTDDFFVFAGNSLGFDVVIYIDNTTELPVGYTEFSSPQGKDITVYIDLDFKGHYEIDESLKVVNSLSTALITPLSERNIIGEKLHTYMSSVRAIDWIEKNNFGTGYTPHLKEIVKNNSNSLLNTGVVKKVSSSPTLVKLSLNDDSGFLDSTGKYNHYSFGYFSGDSVVYLWNDYNEYNIVSLTKVNRFGHAVVYTKSNTNTNNVISLDKASSVKILYGSGKYFTCEVVLGGKRRNRLFDIISKSWIGESITGECFFVDPLDSSSKIYRFPLGILTEDILINKIPSIKDTYESVSKFISSESLYPSIVRKIGNWYIFKYRKGNTNAYIFFGINSTVFMTEEDYERVIVLNDTALILEEDNCYVLLSEPEDDVVRRIYTERFRYADSRQPEKTIANTEVSFRIIQKTYKKNSFVTEYDSVEIPVYNYKENGELAYNSSSYYQKYKNRLAPKSANLMDTFLNGFRRSKYPTELSGLPMIVGALNGILFYKDKNNLNYL